MNTVLIGALSMPLAQAAPPGQAPEAAATFAPDSVPVSTRPLPPFPYLEWPEKLEKSHRHEKRQDFDRAWFVAGAAPVAVEGSVSRRRYFTYKAGLSELEAMRNYEKALQQLGAVRIDTLHPLDKAFPAPDGSKRGAFARDELGVLSPKTAYSAWLVRTPQQRVWIGVAIGGSSVKVTTLEEKKMAQSIAVTKAAEMKAALDKQGFIALYINFDTDKATLRDDGKPAVDEIASLLKQHPTLKIAVEGHTDDSGNARRNKALSEQRAATIVAALRTTGIDTARLKSAGYGADKPIADNRTEEGRARNRRVELVKL